MRRVLRPMRPEKVDSVVTVQQEGAVAAFGHIFPQDAHPFPRAEVQQRWAYELSRSDIQCFVVEGPDRVVDGFVAISGNQLLHFGTAKSTWGSGPAGRAHDEVLDYLREQGHSRAWLSVLEQNGRARRFYEKRGWVPTGRSLQSGFHPIRSSWATSETSQSGKRLRGATAGRRER
jgi:RimJ/RimL family protein N-acetyltransferase